MLVYLYYLQEEAARVQKAHGITVPLKIGNMLETPRAALVADQIASVSQFFSFGTNVSRAHSRDRTSYKHLVQAVNSLTSPVHWQSLAPHSLQVALHYPYTPACRT